MRAGIRFGLVAPGTADLVGQALLAENIASVTARYTDVAASGGMPGPTSRLDPVAWTTQGERGRVRPVLYAYQRRQPGEAMLDCAKVLGVIEGYNYQCCEHPEWNSSAARRYIRALIRRIERQYPGIEPATCWNPPTVAEACLPVHLPTAEIPIPPVGGAS